MALFAPHFGQTSSNYQQGNQQQGRFFFGDQVPVLSSTGAMKRRNVDNNDEPGPKRRHYEDRMAHRLNSLDLSGQQFQQQPNYSDEDDLDIEEIDPEILTETPQQLDDDSNQQPLIEEPDEDSEEDDSHDGFTLHKDFKNYWKNSKNDHILNKIIPKPTGRELVLWRPPPVDPDKLGNPKIEELADGDVEISEYREPIPLPYTQQQLDETRFLHKTGGRVTFPMDESASSSARSSTSPPLGAKGVRKSSFAPNTTTTIPPPPVDEEPMDMD